jgi:hypothetical protein
MALVTERCGAWSDELGYVDWTYDDVSLVLQSFTTQNLSPLTGTVTLTNPSLVTRTVTIPTGTNATVRDVSAFGIVLHRYTTKGGGTKVSVPLGWSYSISASSP